METYSCKSELKRQLYKWYANANMLIRKFSFCSDDVKVRLFKSYCTNAYGTQLILVWFFWKPYENISVGYNNTSLRWLMKLDKNCGASEMFTHYGIPVFGEFQSNSNNIIMCVVLSSVPLVSLIWVYCLTFQYTLCFNYVYGPLLTCFIFNVMLFN